MEVRRGRSRAVEVRGGAAESGSGSQRGGGTRLAVEVRRGRSRAVEVRGGMCVWGGTTSNGSQKKGGYQTSSGSQKKGVACRDEQRLLILCLFLL